VEQLGIVTSGLNQQTDQLSGGNQQKVVVGRALARHPALLVAVSPTVGVDVAAKESLLNVVAAARDGGTAVLLVSDDLEDLRICTRLLVMVKGRLVKEYRQSPWDRHELIAAVEGLEQTSMRRDAEALYYRRGESGEEERSGPLWSPALPPEDEEPNRNE
jgi:simple sugar transport system ATP-binding protein